jgi:hypothetical protein
LYYNAFNKASQQEHLLCYKRRCSCRCSGHIIREKY